MTEFGPFNNISIIPNRRSDLFGNLLGNSINDFLFVLLTGTMHFCYDHTNCLWHFSENMSIYCSYLP